MTLKLLPLSKTLDFIKDELLSSPKENEDEDEPGLDETVNIKDPEETIKTINHLQGNSKDSKQENDNHKGKAGTTVKKI